MLRGGSRQDPSWAFLTEMRSLGHRAAERWLSEDLASVGMRPTVDLAEFEGPRVGAPAGA